MGALDSVFQIGPRIAGQILGSPYAQYRPTTANNPLATQYGTVSAWVTTDPAGKGDRAPLPGKPLWYAQLDTSLTQPGDYLVGPFGTFFIASQYGLMPTQLVACNKVVSLSRPGSGTPGANFYGGARTATLTPIAANWPASVVQGTKGETGEAKLPGDTRLAWVSIMLPAIPGVQILSADWLVTNDATPQQYTISSCELTALGWRLTASLAVT